MARKRIDGNSYREFNRAAWKIACIWFQDQNNLKVFISDEYPYNRPEDVPEDEIILVECDIKDAAQGLGNKQGWRSAKLYIRGEIFNKHAFNSQGTKKLVETQRKRYTHFTHAFKELITKEGRTKEQQMVGVNLAYKTYGRLEPESIKVLIREE